ncbi:MAG: thiamine diphosphokinase [Fusobacteriaceae bacterium]
MRNKIAYIFLNGELLGNEEFYLNKFKEKSGDFYCADGGYYFAKKLKVELKEIWGDMDSVKREDLEIIENNSNIVVKKFLKDKDFTDGELLVEYLTSLNYDTIFIIGGLGGSKSHEMTNLNLLMKFKKIIFLTETETIFYVNKKMSFKNIKGTKLSFIPFSDKVEELTLKGFMFPLDKYNLLKGDSRCISNIILEDNSCVEYKKGVLIGVLENNKF